MNYRKVNRSPLKAYITPAGSVYFNCSGRRYNLKDFIRAGSAWSPSTVINVISGDHGPRPVTIAGYYSKDYYNPLYIETVYAPYEDSGYKINVYRGITDEF